MAKVHVKVNDNVFVLNGKDAGKTGKVLKVDPKNNRVVVEGVNIITKHQKPDMRLNTGGLVKKEAAINASKVMLVCPKCKKPSKTGYRFLDNGDKVRYCKSCNAEIETVRKAK
ncbi:MAG: 50S ribosomal protein L24 [Eubacteriales bacterium]|nr:50S ribosomal protein L24 [Clostridiales bacterium]MDY5836238.1 50S ribosomal protein L24 [Eubacteriales bacterium]